MRESNVDSFSRIRMTKIGPRGMKRVLTQLDSCCFIAFFSVIQAIPIQEVETDFGKASNDTQNVCMHENKIYKEGQNFSTSNPCETCVCDPPGFSCSLTSCDLKPGCKAIHKANHCCPEYVCECERNGKIYGNGEKVEEANPCKVCYCKGGEIKCALVTCYTRDDCEPGYVAGVCCPKYDHCPPLEVMKNKSTSPAPAQVIISDLKTETSPIRNKIVKASAATESYSSTISREISTTELHAAKENSTFAEENVTSTESYQTGETEINTTENEMFAGGTEVWTAENADFTTDETTDETTDNPPTTTEEFNFTITEETATTVEVTENATSDLITTETVTEIGTTTDGITTYEIEDLECTSVAASTTEQIREYTTEFINASLKSESEITTISSEMVTEIPVEEVSNISVVQVIVPKTIKKDIDQVQSSMELPAPIVVRISAEQIQFLKLAEEPPIYVENHEFGDRKNEQLGVVVIPKTTPTTVEMVKVVEGSLTGELNLTAEIAAKSVNNSFSFNNTDFIQER